MSKNLSFLVKANKIRPYLVANIVELLDIDVDEKDEESAFKDVSLEVFTTNYKVKYFTDFTYMRF